MGKGKKKTPHGSYFGAKRGSKGGYVKQLEEIDKSHKRSQQQAQTPGQNAADEIFDSVDDDREDWEKLMDDIKNQPAPTVK